MRNSEYFNRSISRIGDDFSVTSKMADYIGNSTWYKAYMNAKNGIISNSDTSFVWSQLSAINEDVGAAIYSKILNYVNQIGNIDTCGIHALNSMTDMLALEYRIPELNKLYPLEIEELLDVFSINRNIILKSDKILSTATRDTILAQISSALPEYSGVDTRYSIMVSGIDSSIDGRYRLVSGDHDTDNAQYNSINTVFNSNYIKKLDVPTNTNTLSSLAVEKIWAMYSQNGKILATAAYLEGKWYPSITMTYTAEDSWAIPTINDSVYYNTFTLFGQLDESLTIPNYVYVDMTASHDIYYFNPASSNMSYDIMPLYDSTWFIKNMTDDILNPLYVSKTKELSSYFNVYYNNKVDPSILLLAGSSEVDGVIVASNDFIPLMPDSVSVLELSGIYDREDMTDSAFIPRKLTVSNLSALDILNGTYILESNTYNYSITDICVTGLSPLVWTASNGSTINLVISQAEDLSYVYSWTISDINGINTISNEVTSAYQNISPRLITNPPLTGWPIEELVLTYVIGNIDPIFSFSDVYMNVSIIYPTTGLGALYFTDEAYKNYLKTVFAETILDICNLKYREFEAGVAPTSSDVLSGYIWRNIIYELTPESLYKKLETTDPEIIAKKVEYRIPSNFNEISIVDNITIGLQSITDFNESEQVILNLEIARRAKPRVPKYNISKFSKYRENKVKEYFKFVNEFSRNTETLAGLSSYTDYDVDSKYFIYDVNNIEFIKYQADGTPYLDESVVNTLAEKLSEICINVAYSREQLKLQTRKNGIRGTYNLLEYMVKMYIIENIYKKNYLNISSDNLNVDLIEYIDSTEYFNIKALSSDIGNERFWENGAIDSQQIQNFYSELGLDIVSGGTYSDFMRTVFNAGAVSSTSDNINVSSSDYDAFCNYIGTSAGYRPFYNYKNQLHPSYQILPYLQNLTEVILNRYPISNLFQYSTEVYLDDLMNNIQSYLDANGNFIDIWKDGRYDFSGYLSRFEQAQNRLTSQSILIDRDGPFIYEAYQELLLDPQTFTDGIISGENVYYDHLDLNTYDKVFISNAITKNLAKYSPLIGKHIYKYGTDIYGNCYTLYKNVNIADDLGELWIRLKNHPIAIPAFSIYNGELTKDSCILNSFNKSIHSKILEAFENGTSSGQFFDIEIDSSKTIIALAYVPTRDASDSFNRTDVSRANVMFGQVKRVYDRQTNTYVMQFNKDSKHAFEAATVKADEVLFDATINRWHYCGMFKQNGGISALFLKYNSLNGLNIYNPQTGNYETKAQIYVENYHSLYGNSSLNKTSAIDIKYKMSYTDDNLPIIKFAYCDEIISLALQCEYINMSQYIINYCENDPTLTYVNAGALDLSSMSIEKLSFDIFNSLITTIDFTLNKFDVTFDSVRYFTKHTECGCLPLFPGTIGVSNIYRNPILKNLTESEYQLISEPAYISISSVSSNSIVYVETPMEGLAWEDINYPLSSYDYHQALDNNMLSGDVTSSNVKFEYEESKQFSSIAELDLIYPNITPVSSNIVITNDMIIMPELTGYNYSTFYIDENSPITAFYTLGNDLNVSKVYIMPAGPNTSSMKATDMAILDQYNQIATLYYGLKYKYSIELTNYTRTSITFRISKM